jgi:hypothetical protein
VDAETILPHSGFGDSACAGSLNAFILGDEAEIICNLCGVVVRTLAAADLTRTLSEMELSLEVAGEICPQCGSVNLFLGPIRRDAFTCRNCGQEVYIARR